jgi:replicative DNA helicase
MEFSVEFEEEILAQSLRDTEYLKQASRLLDAHHFTSKAHGWVWGVIRETWTKWAERVSPRILMARASRDFEDEAEERAHLELVAKLYRLEPKTPRATLEELQRFVRFVSLQVAMEEGAQALEKGDVDKAFGAVRTATLKDLRPKAHKVTRWIEDFDERQRERKHKAEHPEEYICIPTGIKRLDDIIDGLQAGELGMVMGTTGRGKSIFLTHLGYQAVIRGYGVVHFSLEMPDKQVAARYDSRFTGILHKKFKRYEFSAEELRTIDARLKKNRERLKSKLQIISMPLRRCNINSVRHAIEEARAEMDVHMVLVDSGDHMQGMGKFDQKRIEQAEVYWDLKTLVEEDNLAGWTSTHAGKEWETKIATAEAAAEAYDKSRIVDLIISLNSPKARSRTTRIVEGEEEEEAIAGKTFKRAPLELFLAKYRDGEGKVRIPLDADFAHMLIREAEAEPEPE